MENPPDDDPTPGTLEEALHDDTSAKGEEGPSTALQGTSAN